MKTIVYFTAFLIIFGWTSCRDYTTRRNFERLQGEWWTAGEEGWEGYVFKEDTTCIYKPGYFVCESKDFHPRVENFFPFFNQCILWVYHSLNSETNYRVEEDALSIYNPESGDWEGYTLRFRGPDTLFLSDTEGEKKFVKEPPKEPDTLLLFDRVILYAAFRGLSERDYYEKSISLRCSGEIMHYKMCKSPTEFFGVRGNLAPGDFEYVETLFKQPDVRSYLDNPPPREIRRRTWNESFSITFIKGDEMITLEDPWYKIRTRSFCWAYLTALFADERDQTIEDLYLNEMGLTVRDFTLYNRSDSILSWYNSEKFYLFTLLYHAQETDRDFESQYILESSQPLPEGQKKKVLIETDGRYYRYKRWGRPVTLDIGFNFIERYKLENQFKTDPYLEYR